MAEKTENMADQGQGSVESLVRGFVAALDDKHKMLVVLKAQLYGNRWEPMLQDLQNRLEGKPYIFKLANRIKDDIQRIERMRDFENQYKINLADFVHLQAD